MRAWSSSDVCPCTCRRNRMRPQRCRAASARFGRRKLRRWSIRASHAPPCSARARAVRARFGAGSYAAQTAAMRSGGGGHVVLPLTTANGTAVCAGVAAFEAFAYLARAERSQSARGRRRRLAEPSATVSTTGARRVLDPLIGRADALVEARRVHGVCGGARGYQLLRERGVDGALPTCAA